MALGNNKFRPKDDVEDDQDFYSLDVQTITFNPNTNQTISVEPGQRAMFFKHLLFLGDQVTGVGGASFSAGAAGFTFGIQLRLLGNEPYFSNMRGTFRMGATGFTSTIQYLRLKGN